MAWQYAGQAVTNGRSWSDTIPVFAPQLRLNYASNNPAVLKVQVYGWLRIFYAEQGIYSDRWDRVWPKPQQELVTLHPWEPELGRHEVQFRQGGRYIALDEWSVTIEYWLASKDANDGDNVDLLVGGALFTVGDTSVEFPNG